MNDEQRISDSLLTARITTLATRALITVKGMEHENLFRLRDNKTQAYSDEAFYAIEETLTDRIAAVLKEGEPR